jgi:hypothetical protein
MAKCKYCGSSSYGSGCPHSPTRKHEHTDDKKNASSAAQQHTEAGARTVRRKSTKNIIFRRKSPFYLPDTNNQKCVRLSFDFDKSTLVNS